MFYFCTMKTDSRHSDINQLIIKALVSDGALSIASLSQKVDASIPTVTKYVNMLIDIGLVESIDYSANEQQGRKPRLVEINADAAYFLGVDINNRSIQMAIMDTSCNILKEKEYAFYFANSPEKMEEVCESIESFIGEDNVFSDKIAMIAVNLSGRVNPETGYSYTVFNFEQHDEPLAALLSERLGYKTIIDNDTRAMAYGELKTAVCEKYRNFIFINASWGIGMSIIIDGNIYYGMNGYSGELGHIYAYDNELMCHCGKKGCLETVVSGRAICAQFQKRLNEGKTSILSLKEENVSDITEKDIIDAANNDDPLSIELIEKTGLELGRHIANLINIFNPEAVIIGGTFSLAGDIFLQPIRMAARKYSLNLILKDVDIIGSTLGLRSGVIGACLEAREKYFDSFYNQRVLTTEKQGY